MPLASHMSNQDLLSVLVGGTTAENLLQENQGSLYRLFRLSAVDHRVCEAAPSDGWARTPGPPAPPRVYRPPYRYIGCDLLAPGGKKEAWGYKDMCESMGPCYYTCPLSYLDMVPVANADWRDQVRAWHTARRRKVDVGDILILRGFAIPQIRIVRKDGRRITGEYQGRFYRVSPRVLGGVVEHRKVA